MGRFDFISPGAAVSDTLTKLIAQRKAEERQAMLDVFRQKEEERAAQEAVDQHAASESNRKRSEQQSEIERLNAGMSGMDYGDDPSGMPEDLIQLGKKYNQFDTREEDQPQPPQMAPMEGQDPEETPQMVSTPQPPKKVSRLAFKGTDKQRQDQKDKKQAGDFILSMITSGDPKLAEIGQQMARVLSASGGIRLPKEALELLTPDKPFFNYNEDTGKLTDTKQTIPYNAEVGKQPRPYREPVAPAPYMGGNLQTPDGQPLGYNRTTGKWEIVPNAVRTPTGNQPDANAPTSLGIPSALMLKYDALSAAAAENPDDTEAAKALIQVQYDLIGAAKASPMVKDLAIKFIHDPEAYKKSALQADTMTPKDRADLKILLKKLGGSK